ncbi:High-affinity branched-chain amino acid transport system permease protein LivH [compost metagenome]
MWFVLPIALGVAALFGVMLGAPTLKLRGDYLAIVTLGFGEIVRIFMNNLDRPINITNGPKGITAVDPVHIFGFDFSKSHEIFGLKFTPVFMYYYLLVFLVIVIVFVCLRLQNSRIGRAWVAIREDEIAAKAMGINTRNVKLLAFAMGASFGGVSGAVFGAFQGFVSPESFTLWESIYILAIVVLGGMGHIPGVILGGILLVGFQELLRVVAEPMQTGLFGHVIVDAEVLRQLMFGLALVGVMLYRPAGLWPSPRKEDRPVVRRAGSVGRF